MAILANDVKIEQIEFSAGITEAKEFRYKKDKISVPSGIEYHKIITKDKRIVYQTFDSPRVYSQVIERLKNLTPFEGYLKAKKGNPPKSKYFKNQIALPKKSQYQKGFFTRYFLQMASDEGSPVLEVRKREYMKADATYRKIDFKWSLNGNIEKQELENIRTVENIQKTFPQIRVKVYNFVEFHKSD